MSWFADKTPEVANAFRDLRETIYKDGALDVKTKELISIVASILMRCETCVEIHTRRAKEYGTTDEQIAEAITCAMFVAAGSQLSWTPIYDIMVFKEENKKDNCEESDEKKNGC